ncbi:MAG: helix-turn-helix domain-containing protein [Tannerellaceae bacterium]|nr:helix-turn-helix domain-containing protein [Tannerellaceae bacterium]
MMSSDVFPVQPYELKKVEFKKGENLICIEKPLIAFIQKKGVGISLKREFLKTTKGEEMIFLPPGFPCLFSLESDTEVYFLYLSDPLRLYIKYIAFLSEKTPLPKKLLVSLPLLEPIHEFLSSLLEYQKENLLSPILLEIKTAELFTLLKLLFPASHLTHFFAPVLLPGYSFMLKVLSAYKKVKSVEELAQKTALSLSGFHRLFQKVFGTTPYKWLIQKRIQLLFEELTTSDKPLKQVAFECGFSSLSQMIRFCKKHHGTTPGEIRKRKEEKKWNTF